MAPPVPEAYCTLLLSDGYLPGAMVLAHSLRDAGTKKQLAALVTLDSVSAASIDQLKTVYDHILPVDRIANKSPANLYLMDRPDLGSVFTKIAIWRQTQFKRLVYIDADVVALRAPDELFRRESPFAAAPDVGWPDCFNSGVMAITPNIGDYYALLAMAQRGISFDGGDQGLLNMHFSQWDRISFTYNCTPNAHYQYVPAYRHFQSSISMIHFIGKDKPWTTGRDGGGGPGVYDELLGRWWAVYDRHFRGAVRGPFDSRNEAYQEQTYTYVPDQGHVPNHTVQQHVHGEWTPQMWTMPTNQPTQPPPPPPESTFIPPYYQTLTEVAPASVGTPLFEPADPDEKFASEELKPTPTVEQRRFSAPQSEWDPIREAPPTHSRPEAANFPQQVYTMSEDKTLFQPPKSYPEPPKDMWYELPKTPPAAERPKPIFPWEASQAKATRVFPNEEPAHETETATSIPAPIDTSSTAAATKESPTTPTIQVTPVESFGSYNRVNAWDEHPSIQQYMSRFNFGRRAKVQVLHSSSDNTTTTSTERRRPSLKLTDFPTEVERPSLPVTPAPVRRDVFWAGERDEEGELPGAEGVPAPADWDPLRKLEELQKKQSTVLAEGPRRPSLDAPQRILPESAALLPSAEENVVPPTSVAPVTDGGKDGKSVSATLRSQKTPATGKEGHKSVAAEMEELDDGAMGEDEGVFSPT